MLYMVMDRSCCLYFTFYYLLDFRGGIAARTRGPDDGVLS